MKAPLDESFLLEKIQYGKDATNLIQNKTWRIIIQKFQSDALQAFWDLANIDPMDSNEIMKLQNRIQRYSDLVLELDTVVKASTQAQTILEEELIDE